MKSSVESSDMQETPQIELPPLTEDEITAQKELLERGIELGMKWFEFGQDEEQFKGMTEKEQVFTRLLDPMVWLMREAHISYVERADGCEDCTGRVERRENGLQLAIAEMLLSGSEPGDG